jgi:uncharacterized protein
MNFKKSFTISVLSVFLCSCSHLFLHPTKIDYSERWKERSEHVQEGFFQSRNGKKLHYWLMGGRNEKPKAVVLQFHGNAGNMTSHALNVIWLSQHNLQVIAFDYQAYGQSEGVKSVSHALEDSFAAMEMASAHAKKLKVPLVLFGQSLGGSLMLKTLKDHPQRWDPKLVIVESAFYSYPMIAKEKLALFFITWPLQWMSYLLIPTSYNPGGADLKNLEHMAFLFLYSEEDPIVPIHHGRLLFADLTSKDKEFWNYPESAHVAYAYVNKGANKEKLLNHILKHL